MQVRLKKDQMKRLVDFIADSIDDNNVTSILLFDDKGSIPYDNYVDVIK